MKKLLGQAPTEAIKLTLLFLLLVLSSPFKHRLPLAAQVMILLLALGAMVKWTGAPLRRHWTWHLLIFGAAYYWTSLLLDNVGPPWQTMVSVGSLVTVLVISITLVRSSPPGASLSRVRVAALSSVMVFALFAKLASNTAIASMREGDFFVMGVPYFNRIVLPHPYDSYFVRSVLPFVTLLSLISTFALSSIYLIGSWAQTRKPRDS